MSGHITQHCCLLSYISTPFIILITLIAETFSVYQIPGHFYFCLQELHAHLNGSVSFATMEKLIARKPHLNIESNRTAILSGQRRTLAECVLNSLLSSALIVQLSTVVCTFVFVKFFTFFSKHEGVFLAEEFSSRSRDSCAAVHCLPCLCACCFGCFQVVLQVFSSDYWPVLYLPDH